MRGNNNYKSEKKLLFTPNLNVVFEVVFKNEYNTLMSRIKLRYLLFTLNLFATRPCESPHSLSVRLHSAPRINTLLHLASSRVSSYQKYFTEFPGSTVRIAAYSLRTPSQSTRINTLLHLAYQEYFTEFPGSTVRIAAYSLRTPSQSTQSQYSTAFGTLIYTDGSKNEIGHTSSGVFVKHGRGVASLKRRNADYCSVFRSEMIATDMALDFVLKHQLFGEIWILSDSRSVVQYLDNWRDVSDGRGMAIFNKLRTLCNSCVLHLQWIP
ncbi:hypothetical protein AVEN_36585-1 [Araneus ventricosus]|uniref:Uncharacterized protein n=1 Tax=Araneus ventricosus TaxID=182803 RepID=A0A4Y2Q830_ARAVE|nr:hypothetical protein AVEN_36585-1 [Araneus ventricosus]